MFGSWNCLSHFLLYRPITVKPTSVSAEFVFVGGGGGGGIFLLQNYYIKTAAAADKA